MGFGVRGSLLEPCALAPMPARLRGRRAVDGPTGKGEGFAGPGGLPPRRCEVAQKERLRGRRLGILSLQIRPEEATGRGVFCSWFSKGAPYRRPGAKQGGAPASKARAKRPAGVS